MDKDYLNNLARDVKSGKVDVQEAVECLAVVIQTEGGLFGLNHYDEDVRSNVVVGLLEKAHKLFYKYDEKLGSFFNYFYSFVKGLIHKEIRNIHSQKEKRVMEMIGNNDNKYFGETELRDNDDNDIKLEYDNNPESAMLKSFMMTGRKRGIGKACIVLAMKSCFDVTDNDVKKICEMIDVPEAELLSTLQKMRENAIYRHEKVERLEAARNASYYFKRKFASELKIGRGNARLYDVHVHRWMRQNEKLVSGSVRAAPTNKCISDALGISERQVSNYIEKVREIVDEFSDEEGRIDDDVLELLFRGRTVAAMRLKEKLEKERKRNQENSQNPISKK